LLAGFISRPSECCLCSSATQTAFHCSSIHENQSGGFFLPVELTPDAADEAFSQLSLTALARSKVFGSIALAFFDPTPEIVQDLLSGSFVSELDGSSHDLAVHHKATTESLEPLKTYQVRLAGHNPGQLLKEMKVEYARLFIGPSRPTVRIYETFYANQGSESTPLLIVSPTAKAVEEAYREGGVAMAAGPREPPDHFATEAEFLYYLCKKESDGWAERDNVVAQLWRRRELAFLDGHLGRWGCQFCRQVEQESSHPFYQAAAHFARDFLQMEGSDA
jgi:TorA maturation chaperone TorD